MVRNGRTLLTTVIEYDNHRGYVVRVTDPEADLTEILWSVGTEEEARARADAFLEGYGQGYDHGYEHGIVDR